MNEGGKKTIATHSIAIELLSSISTMEGYKKDWPQTKVDVTPSPISEIQHFVNCNQTQLRIGGKFIKKQQSDTEK